MATVVREHRWHSGAVLQVVHGNIVHEVVDAIVNAANQQLRHGGGVAGAIVSAGGRAIQEESNRVAPVQTGACAVTGAGALPCRYVIHAVGPVYSGSQRDDELLTSAVRSALGAAEKLGLASISMPAISSGIFGFPKDRCARILLDESCALLGSEPPPHLCTVRLCNFDQETVAVFAAEFDRMFGADD